MDHHYVSVLKNYAMLGKNGIIAESRKKERHSYRKRVKFRYVSGTSECNLAGHTSS